MYYDSYACVITTAHAIALQPTGPMPKLMQVLEKSAAGGCRGAKVALEALSQQPGQQETLVFKM